MKIPVLHLPDGIDHFEQEVKAASLHFSYAKNYPKPIHVRVKLNKYEQNIQCEAQIKTIALLDCDRCLQQFERPVATKFGLLLHVGDEPLETDEDDVVHVPRETVELDWSDWIAEALVLEIPMKALCRDDCKGICAGCGVDLNEESCGCETAPLDPRWEKLRELRKS